MGKGVGFIGLGTMGLPFASNIASAGFDLMVYDLRPEPLDQLHKLGAKIGESARDVAEYSDVVHIAVPHEAEVDATLQGEEGVFAGAAPGTVIALHSSIHPANMRRVAEEARAHGVEILDTQMSGGARGVINHTLCFMVGGDEAALAKCRPMLETTGSAIFHMGPVGTGALTKVAQNTMTSMHLAVAAEVFRFAEKAGIEPRRFEEVVKASAAQSHVADTYLDSWAPRDLKWMYYEVLEDALQLAREVDSPLPGAALAQQVLATILRK